MQNLDHKTRDSSRITAAQMKFVRRSAGVTKWNLKRKDDILKELTTKPILQVVNNQRKNLENHVRRMDRTCIPKQILQYAPYGRSVGRLDKRWTDVKL